MFMCKLNPDNLMGFRIRTVDLLYTRLDTIHAEFTYNFGVSTLWDTVLKGKTLADVVAGIFTGVTTALQSVKDGLDAAWNGIKEAGNFIVSSVVDSILQSFVVVAHSFIDVIFSILSSVSSSITLIGPRTIDVNGNMFTIGLKYQDMRMSIDFGTTEFPIFDWSSLFAETLGGDSDIWSQIVSFFADTMTQEIFNIILSEFTVYGLMIANNLIPQAFPFVLMLGMMSFSMSTIAQVQISENLDPLDPMSSDIASFMYQYHLFSILYLLVSLATSTTSIEKLMKLTLKNLLIFDSTPLVTELALNGIFDFMVGDADPSTYYSLISENIAFLIVSLFSFSGIALTIRREEYFTYRFEIIMLIIYHFILAYIWRLATV